MIKVTIDGKPVQAAEFQIQVELENGWVFILSEHPQGLKVHNNPLGKGLGANPKSANSFVLREVRL